MLTIDDIVKQANTRTENRAASKLDLGFEFQAELQNFCRENRFWWLRKTAKFTTVVGTSTYDLSAAGLDIAPDMAEIIGVYRFNSMNQIDAELVPIIDELTQEQCLENTVQGDVVNFFISPGTLQTIALGAPADNAVLLHVAYWAGFDINTGSDNTAVPLVPFWLHGGLVTILERRIFSYLYGQEDPRYEVADNQYKAFVEQAQRRPYWTVQKQRELRSGLPAVQAHG